MRESERPVLMAIKVLNGPDVREKIEHCANKRMLRPCGVRGALHFSHWSRKDFLWSFFRRPVDAYHRWEWQLCVNEPSVVRTRTRKISPPRQSRLSPVGQPNYLYEVFFR